MRYMLLIYGDERAWASATPEETQRTFDEYSEYTKWLAEKGWMQGGDPLQTSDHATTVRAANGETLTTDGPFAETKEQLGGYYIVECEDLDQAIDAAARCPGAKHGTMEVRPIADMGAANA